jgi:SAM-dependent methyltransferase
MAEFADHFSSQAAAYRRHRPGYPPALFDFLAAQAPARLQAWDCGCGSGQATGDLAARFARVIATDPSMAQLAEAEAFPNVTYRRAAERDPAIADASVDLLTAAQAAHWFAADRFHAEAARVLKPGGVLALWTYSLPRIDAGVDACLEAFHTVTVGPYWPPERVHVDNGYRDLPFPWPDLPVPAFAHVLHWSLEDLLSHLGTWSAVRYCRERTGTDPVTHVRADLARAWGATRVRAVRWPISLRAGRRPAGRNP